MIMELEDHQTQVLAEGLLLRLRNAAAEKLGEAARESSALAVLPEDAKERRLRRAAAVEHWFEVLTMLTAAWDSVCESRLDAFSREREQRNYDWSKNESLTKTIDDLHHQIAFQDLLLDKDAGLMKTLHAFHRELSDLFGASAVRLPDAIQPQPDTATAAPEGGGEPSPAQ